LKVEGGAPRSSGARKIAAAETPVVERFAFTTEQAFRFRFRASRKLRGLVFAASGGEKCSCQFKNTPP